MISKLSKILTFLALCGIIFNPFIASAQTVPGYVFRVDNQSEPGSGFFIRIGSNLFFVTARHVLGRSVETIKLTRQDGNVIEVAASRQIPLSEIDLAVIPFATSEVSSDVGTASLGPLVDGESLAVWGFPINAKSIKSNIQYRQGNFIGKPLNPQDGYEILYAAKTQVGFSGGPILRSDGTIVGVHGRSEGQVNSLGKEQRTGNALGIPIQLLLSRLIAKGSTSNTTVDLSLIKRDSAVLSLRHAVEVLSNPSMTDQVLVDLAKADEGKVPAYCTQMARAYYYTFYNLLAPNLSKANQALTAVPQSKDIPAIYFAFATLVTRKSGDFAQSLNYQRLAERGGGKEYLEYSDRRLMAEALAQISKCADDLR